MGLEVLCATPLHIELFRSALEAAGGWPQRRSTGGCPSCAASTAAVKARRVARCAFLAVALLIVVGALFGAEGAATASSPTPPKHAAALAGVSCSSPTGAHSGRCELSDPSTVDCRWCDGGAAVERQELDEESWEDGRWVEHITWQKWTGTSLDGVAGLYTRSHGTRLLGSFQGTIQGTISKASACDGRTTEKCRLSRVATAVIFRRSAAATTEASTVPRGRSW